MSNCQYIDLSKIPSRQVFIEIESDQQEHIVFYNSNLSQIELLADEQNLLSKLIKLDNHPYPHISKSPKSSQNLSVHIQNLSAVQITFFLIGVDIDLEVVCNSLEESSLEANFWLHLQANHTKIETTQHIEQNNCSSRLTCQSILDSNSQVNFDGLIEVYEDVDGVESSWHHHVLKLHPQTKLKSKPSLRIRSDKVRVDHGLAITSMAGSVVQYMASRGLSSIESKDLQIQAKFNQFKKHLPTICFAS
jgi:hypothetical protein